MRRFQHKELPNIEVTAEQVGQDTYASLAHSLGAQVVKEINKETQEVFMGLNVLTRSGFVRASEGCWIVDSAVGIFVLTPTHFEQKYEEIIDPIATQSAHLDAFKARGGKVNGE